MKDSGNQEGWIRLSGYKAEMWSCFKWRFQLKVKLQGSCIEVLFVFFTAG
jgi:hypothetical protein